MNRMVKIFIVITGSLLLILPLVQYHFKLFEEKKLYGSYSITEAPDLTLDTWLDFSFQDQFDKYIRDHIGFRNFFIRLHNQLQFTLFQKTTAKDVEIGRKGYLYEGGYIRDYLGLNFIGYEKIEQRVNELKEVQQEIIAGNSAFVIVFAPGKASFFPEYLPNKYDTIVKTISNYEMYVEQCKKQGIHHIDFNSYFTDLKTQISYELFPKGGIHWGQYGVTVAYDTISQYIEKVFNVPMVDFNFSEVYYPDTLRQKDKDISAGMNLLFEYPAYKMPEPIIKMDDTSEFKRPSVLIVGDSFGSRLMESPLTNDLFSHSELWYYNRGIVPVRSRNIYEVKHLNVQEEIKKFDIIILVASETNMYKFDFGFSKTYYSVPEKKDFDYYYKRISEDTEWMKIIEKQAIKLNIPVDSALVRDARSWARKQNQ